MSFVDKYLAVAESYIDKVTYGSGPGELDCSAFVRKVLGITNLNAGSEWIVNDILHNHTLFVQIPAPRRGAVGAYNRAMNSGKGGHVVLVADPKKRTIIDSSEGKGGVFAHDGSYMWQKAAKGQAVWGMFKPALQEEATAVAGGLALGSAAALALILWRLAKR